MKQLYCFSAYIKKLNIIFLWSKNWIYVCYFSTDGKTYRIMNFIPRYSILSLC